MGCGRGSTEMVSWKWREIWGMMVERTVLPPALCEESVDWAIASSRGDVRNLILTGWSFLLYCCVVRLTVLLLLVVVLSLVLALLLLLLLDDCDACKSDWTLCCIIFAARLSKSDVWTFRTF